MSAAGVDIGGDLALAVPLDGMQLIEASAGTGKTFTIAGLYARLVVERGLSVRQILVMTFTRAATEELRGRLRERLNLCAALAASPDSDPQAPMPATDPGYEHRWALALLRRARAAGLDADELSRRLRGAAMGMDEAAIFTIHGFCQRVLVEHGAFLDGVVPGAELVPGDRDLLDDFAADFWLRVAGEGDAAQLDALRALAPTPDELARKLGGLVAFAGDIEPQPAAVPMDAGAGTDQEVDAAWRRLVALWSEHAEVATGIFGACFDGGHLHGARFRDGCVETLRELAARIGDGFGVDPGELAKFGQARIADAVKKGRPAFAGHAAFAAIDDWVAANSAADVRRCALLTGLLQRAVGEARAWLAERKRVLARLSYDDQVAQVHAGLHGGASARRLAAALREQFPCALIDEFQDTDARQFAIFETLYRGHGTLFAIGDPKQAIYGFRGGDVHAYLRAARLADARHHLHHNFRSSPSMLAATEALFTARGDDAFIEPGIRFESVQWGGRADDGALRVGDAAVPALTLWPLPDDGAGKPLAAADARAALVHGCAVAIARLLAPGAASLRGEPLRPGNIAVLVNRNDEAIDILDALRVVGVAAVCVRKESIYATREAHELLRLLDALLAPQDMALARGALAGDWLGRTLADFRDMAADEAAWRGALQELAELRERWFARGVLAMLELLAERHAPRLLALDDGERRMGNLLQLGDALQAEARGRAGERVLRDWLAQRIRDADRDNEEEQLRLESDAERVQIVTLHGSKGLEYDLVFLPFAATMGPRQLKRGDFVRFHRDDALVARLLVGSAGERKDASYDAVLAGESEAIAAAAEEDRAERVRLLYVGVTRARHACWMSCGGKKAAAGVLGWLFPDDEYCEALMEQPPGVVGREALPSGTAEVPPPPAPAPLAGARRFERQLERDWWLHSFSRLAEGGHHDAGDATGAAADEALAPEPEVRPVAPEVPGWPRGARYGNAVHAILEQADFAAWRGVATPPPGERDRIERELRGAGYGGEELEVARAATARLVAAALNAPVLPGLCLADVAPRARRAELEFHFGIAGADPARCLELLHAHGYQRQRRDFARLRGSLRGLMNGIVDLVFVHEGRWWIVDYKTNHLGPYWSDYAPARLPAAIAAHDYDLQYLIYTVAVHRWLRQVLGADYDYERDMGGVRYLFLRGMQAPGMDGNGVFADRPPAALVEALDDLLHAPSGAHA